MFDASKEFLVKIISGGVKQCALRFPSDAQWSDRARRQRSTRHFIGRGKSQTSDTDTSATDLQLFSALRVEPGVESFDAAEAAAFIERLESTEVTAGSWAGNARRIEMKVPGAHTVHVLRSPTQAEMRAHEKASTSQTFSNRSAETRVTLEPSGELYDKLAIVEKREGYTGAVPIVHKVAAVSHLLATLHELLAEENEDPEA
jgi:hypothetical protein